MYLKFQSEKNSCIIYIGSIAIDSRLKFSECLGKSQWFAKFFICRRSSSLSVAEQEKARLLALGALPPLLCQFSEKLIAKDANFQLNVVDVVDSESFLTSGPD
jgi:hypothetical protein